MPSKPLGRLRPFSTSRNDRETPMLPKNRPISKITLFSNTSRPYEFATRANTSVASKHPRIWLFLILCCAFSCAHLPRLSHLSESVCRAIRSPVSARWHAETVSIAWRENGLEPHRFSFKRRCAQFDLNRAAVLACDTVDLRIRHD